MYIIPITLVEHFMPCCFICYKSWMIKYCKILVFQKCLVFKVNLVSFSKKYWLSLLRGSCLCIGHSSKLGRDKVGIRALGFPVVNGAIILWQDHNYVNESMPIFIGCGTMRGLRNVTFVYMFSSHYTYFLWPWNPVVLQSLYLFAQ